MNVLKIKKQFALTFIIGCLLMLNCESEDVNSQKEFYVYEFESVELIDSSYESKFFNKTNKNEHQNLILSCTFKTNMQIPLNIIETKDVDLFENFLNENEDEIEGELTFYFNGIVDNVFILNSENQLKAFNGGEYPGRNECSYEGVRQCVRYNIYEGMNTVGKLICALAGTACIAEQAAQCTSRNCFGDTAPNG